MKVVKSKKGYFYKELKDGKRSRINKKTYDELYLKYKKINQMILGVNKVIKKDKYAYPSALKYVERYVKNAIYVNYSASEIAMCIYEDHF